MDKIRIKKNLLKIGIDACGIGACTGLAFLVPQFIPVLAGLEVVLGVTAGIWAYMPLRSLISKLIDKHV